MVEPLRFAELPALPIAGLGVRLADDPRSSIPALWQRFGPHIGRIEGQVPGVAYGVCRHADTDVACFDYVAGCEVVDFDGVPADWVRLTLPAQRYAVFEHRGHAAASQHTVQAIFTEWLPASGLAAIAALPGSLGFFERYGPGFDAGTGLGDIEIWVPLEH